jgi:serine/threonine protein kinase/Tfp pilus assembly protein PilF
MNAAAKTCAKCGAALSAGAALDVCPHCIAPQILAPATVEGDASASAPPPTGASPRPVDPLERPGDRIGHYKLLQKLGEGGCGVVYMAEQEGPVRRRVALKIIKPGMDTRQVVARFEAERQALALMDHPNIAKVFDGGTTTTGRPFFVMELVRGVRITEYCDENNLPTTQRLDLFVQVCHAVQHAHQKGIIHRDLKPSNILVTINDGVPVPKVIDFGIAKATEQRLTDKTLFTEFHQFIGTPAYMSPEQALMTSLDIDTRSDIYSLGVLLYELLTGRTPLDTPELMKVGVDEMRRTIREVEPARPSNRLSTLPREDLTTAARRRSTNPPQLIHAITGDLDWIVMKCLEKDRTRRYETANGLAADIHRHLNNEPIVARPPSRLYQFRKLVRRNRVAFTAAVAVLLALLTGLGFSTWALFRERAARREAATEATKSATVARFHKDMIGSMRPSIAMGRDTTLLREFADKTFEQLGKDLGSQPAVELELRAALGRVFLTLGDYRKAESLYQETLPKMRDLLGAEHPDVADLLQNYAEVLYEREKFQESESLAREAQAIYRQRNGEENPDVAYSLMLIGNALRGQKQVERSKSYLDRSLALYRKLYGPEHRDVALVLRNLARTFEYLGRSRNAGETYQQALAMAKKLLGDVDPLVVLLTQDLAGFQHVHASLEEMEITYRELLANQRRLLGNDNRQVAKTLGFLASTLVNKGQAAKAEPIARESVELHRKLYGDDHLETAKAQGGLGVNLMRQNRHAEAEPLLRAAAITARKLLPPDDTLVAISIQNLGINLADQEKFGEAEVWFREQAAQARTDEAAKRARRAKPSQMNPENPADPAPEDPTNSRPYVIRVVVAGPVDKPGLDPALGNLAGALGRQKKYPEAESIYREMMERFRVRLPSSEEDLASVSASLGRILTDWAWEERNPKSEAVERARESEHLMREALASRLKRTNATPWKTSEWKSRLGASLVSVAATDLGLSSAAREAKLAEAEPLLLEGNEAVQMHPSADRKSRRHTLERLVRLYEAWNKPSEAETWRAKLAAFDRTKAKAGAGSQASTTSAP